MDKPQQSSATAAAQEPETSAAEEEEALAKQLHRTHISSDSSAPSAQKPSLPATTGTDHGTRRSVDGSPKKPEASSSGSEIGRGLNGGVGPSAAVAESKQTAFTGKRKMFVGGITGNIGDATFQQLFEPYGRVVEAIVLRSRVTGHSRGFGFVTFATEEGLQKALKANIVYNFRRFELKVATPRGNSTGHNEVKKVFVGGLPPSINDAALAKYFSSVGKVDSASVVLNPMTHRSRGFGFVTFKDDGAVERCLSREHVIADKPVECRKATPKRSLRTQAAQQQQPRATGYQQHYGLYRSQGSSLGTSLYPPPGGGGAYPTSPRQEEAYVYDGVVYDQAGRSLPGSLNYPVGGVRYMPVGYGGTQLGSLGEQQIAYLQQQQHQLLQQQLLQSQLGVTQQPMSGVPYSPTSPTGQAQSIAQPSSLGMVQQQVQQLQYLAYLQQQQYQQQQRYQPQQQQQQMSPCAGQGQAPESNPAQHSETVLESLSSTSHSSPTGSE